MPMSARVVMPTSPVVMVAQTQQRHEHEAAETEAEDEQITVHNEATSKPVIQPNADYGK